MSDDYPFRLGAKVTFTKVLGRFKDKHWIDKMHPESRKLIEPRNLGYYSYPSFWGENVFASEAPVSGIIVGRKTLSDGYTTLDRDNGNQYCAVRHFTAWEVAYSLHRKPVLVLFPQRVWEFVQIPEPVYEYQLTIPADSATLPILSRRPQPEPWEEIDDPQMWASAMEAAYRSEVRP